MRLYVVISGLSDMSKKLYVTNLMFTDNKINAKVPSLIIFIVFSVILPHDYT